MDNGRSRSRKSVARWTVAFSGLVVGSLLLVACGGTSPESAPAPQGSGADFKIVAYQGDAVLGGHNSTFVKVFNQGKPVVLNFWAGLCPPCRAEMPGFQKVSAAFQGKVIFVGIDIGPFLGLGNHDDATRLYKELGIQYPLAFAVDSSPIQRYGVVGMPTTVFLNARGEIVEKQTGIIAEGDLRNRIQKLIASPS